MNLADRYTSHTWMAEERQRLWRRVWLLAGVSLDVASAGQRAVFDLGVDSVVVVRGEDGVLRAFHNVCPHRGHPLCDGLGKGASLVCPYHRWTFGLDGRLTRRADEEQFDGEPVALSPVRCEEWGGFVWVCLDPDGGSLDDWLGPVADGLASYGHGRFGVESDVTMPLDCNWKVSLDVHNESYHVHTLHPQTLGLLDDTAVEVTRLDPHARMVVPFGRPSGRRAAGGIDPALAGRMRQAGLDPSTVDPADSRQAIIEAERSRHPGSSLSDSQLVDNHMFYVFPNLQFNCYADHLMLFRHRPHPTDPGRCLFDQLTLGRHLRGRTASHRRLSRDGDTMGPVTDADLVVAEQVQRGMGSLGFRAPRLGKDEACIALMHEGLTAWVGATA